LELKPTTSNSSKNLKSKKKLKHTTAETQIVVEVELAQDPTALRSRKGDTGSVLWRLRCKNS
jgi:protein N-lysine methyltransferase METTL21D